jgi:hypothetical protein
MIRWNILRLALLLAFPACTNGEDTKAHNSDPPTSYPRSLKLVLIDVDSIELCHVHPLTNNVFKVSIARFDTVFGDEATCSTEVDAKRFTSLFNQAIERNNRNDVRPSVTCRVIAFSKQAQDTIGISWNTFEFRGVAYFDSTLTDYVRKDLLGYRE